MKLKFLQALADFDSWFRKEPLIASFWIAVATATVVLVIIWAFWAPKKPLHLVCYRGYTHAMGNDLVVPVLDVNNKKVKCETEIK